MIKFKKAIGFILLITTFFSFLTVNGFSMDAVKGDALGADTMLKEAILKVKDIFKISESLDKFDYNISTYNNDTVYNFSWRNSKTEENISISYTADQNVLSYYSYLPETDRERKKLYKINKEKAKELAFEFMKLAIPKEYSNFKYVDESLNSGYGSYNFRYQYYKSGVMVDGASIMIDVSGESGKITSFNNSADFKLAYPTLDDIIGKDEAKKAYKSNIDLKLQYNTKMNYKDGEATIENVFPVFVPKYGFEYAINAKTGGRVLLYSPYIGGYMGMGEHAYKMKSDEKLSLSPQEQLAVSDIAGLMKKDDAIKAVFSKGLPNLTSEFKLSSANLFKSKLNTTGGYVWNIYFEKQDTKDYPKDNYFVSIDAKTGEVIGFNYAAMQYDSKSGEYKINDVKKLVEDFLKKINNEKFSKTKLDQTTPLYELYKKGSERYVSLNYVRIENNIEYPDNFINVTYDSLTKSIVGYNVNWYDVKFNELLKLTQKDAIFEKIFTENEFGLEYKISNNNNTDKTVNIVYAPKPNKPLVFDAYSGNRLNYDGQIAEDLGVIGKYEDIEGHFAQKYINELATINIGFFEKKFRPNDTTAQIDLMYLIYQSLKYSYVEPKPVDKLSEDDIKNIYNELKRKQIINENEISPKTIIKRIDAVKFLVRAIGYGELAKHNEIFVCDFKDFNSISNENKGFVAIAKALGLVFGTDGKFLAENNITRAEAAILIYRYLLK